MRMEHLLSGHVAIRNIHIFDGSRQYSSQIHREQLVDQEIGLPKLKVSKPRFLLRAELGSQSVRDLRDWRFN
jgi:hypothetical protein